MQGVVLAGGRGTRLRPTTKAVNKHLLPVYDDPMIYYPVRTLVGAGIDDILVVSTPDAIGKCAELLEEDFDVDFSYRAQVEPMGVAHALGLAEGFVDGAFALTLGDNILLADVGDAIEQFQDAPTGAKVFLTKVDQPERYGIATLSDRRVVDLEEKPDDPASDHAVIGLYLYTDDVFDKIDQIEPSDRGELEITDVNRQYLRRNELGYAFVDGDWFDAGTPEGLYQAATHVRTHRGKRNSE